jgi:2-(1,2-epoxy-1,2-dihydrophenyl)acetyl-CoA isomerase
MELVLLNRTLSAREALDWGIANRVVSDASLAEEVHSTAANSLQGLRELMERRKRLMHSVLLKASKQIEMELAGSRLWRIPRTLARQSRLSRAERAPVFTGR